MAAGDLINMSLDEIIARGGPQYKMNRRGARRGSRGGGRGGFGNYIPVVANRASQHTVLQRAPGRTARGDGQCVVYVSNLGPMVTTADLQELFAEHPYVDVAIQYEEDGSTSGNAIVLFKRFEEGMRLKREFLGVKLDGRVMDLYVATSDDFNRNGVSQGRVSKRIRGSTNGFFGRRRGSMNGFTRGRGGGGGGGGTQPRKQVTAEELDAELDAYMRGSKHPKISAP